MLFIFFAVFFIAASAGSLLAENASGPLPGMAREKPPIALVIAPENFRDEELFVPLELLQKVGYRTTIASTRIGKAVGMLEGAAEVQSLISDLRAENLSGIILIGGTGAPAHLWDEPALRVLVQELAKVGKPIGAICLSPIVLSRAGLLKGKKATAWKDEKVITELKAGGAAYFDKSCVEDGLIITGNGPEAAAAFAKAFVKKLPEVGGRAGK